MAGHESLAREVTDDIGSARVLGLPRGQASSLEMAAASLAEIHGSEPGRLTASILCDKLICDILVMADDERAKRDVELHGRRQKPETALPETYQNEAKYRRRREVLSETLERLQSPEQRLAVHVKALRNHALWKSQAPIRGPGTEVRVLLGDWGEVTARLTRETGETFAVLTMANTKRPGGGYIEGMPAQEQNIFRRTDIHFHVRPEEVDKETDRYLPSVTDQLKVGRAFLDTRRPLVCIRGGEDMSPDLGYPFHSDEMLFRFYQLRASAQDLREEAGFSREECQRRIDAQLDALTEQGCQHVVLSAFGCGARGNPPEEVAACYRRSLEARRGRFRVVAFAIFNAGYSKDCLESFQKAFDDWPESEDLVRAGHFLDHALRDLRRVEAHYELTFDGALRGVEHFTAERTCLEYVKDMAETIPSLERIAPACETVAKRNLERLPRGAPELSLDHAVAIAFYSYEEYGSALEEQFYEQLSELLRKRCPAIVETLKPYLFFLLGALDRLPPYEGQVYRGIPKDALSITQTEYEDDSVIHWSSFTSTTTSKVAARDFAGSDGIIFVLHVVEGRNIKSYSAIKGEHEILLKPNTAFRVTKPCHQATDGAFANYYVVEMKETKDCYTF